MITYDLKGVEYQLDGAFCVIILSNELGPNDRINIWV